MSERITKSEFESMLRGWAEEVKLQMRDRLKAGTSGSGYLASELKTKVGESNHTVTHYIGFKFKKYGVFVHYGVGRGWVRQGNAVVPGSRVRKGSAVVPGSRVRKGSKMEGVLQKKGYSRKDIKKHVVGSSGSGKSRNPVDWFDSVLKQHMEELATVAQDYYGDYSQEKLAEQLDRMTIGKKGT